MISPCYCWLRQDPLLRAPTLVSEALDRKTVDRMEQVSDDGYGKGVSWTLLSRTSPGSALKNVWCPLEG